MRIVSGVSIVTQSSLHVSHRRIYIGRDGKQQVPAVDLHNGKL